LRTDFPRRSEPNGKPAFGINELLTTVGQDRPSFGSILIFAEWAVAELLEFNGDRLNVHLNVHSDTGMISLS
jgi:hypothetical protein